MKRQERRAAYRTYVDSRLRNQLRLFFVILVVMVVLDTVRMVRGGVNPLWALAGFLVGLVLGIVLSRTKALGWDASEHMVAGTTDAIGAAILALYIIFIMFKTKLVGEVIDDPNTVGVVGLSLTAGAMFGRIHFTLRGIGRVLRLAASGADHAPGSSSNIN